MRRIDQLRIMSIYEIADWIIKTGIWEQIGFSQSAEKCAGCTILQPGGCRGCLIEWLKEDGEL